MKEPKTNRRKTGAEYEQMAAEHVRKNGALVLEKNFRCRMGEVDLIIRDQDTLAFLEVKYRSRPDSGHPAEAVCLSKQKTICRTADYYRMKKRLPEDRSFRFDVVAILGSEITWYKNAFEYVR